MPTSRGIVSGEIHYQSLRRSGEMFKKKNHSHIFNHQIKLVIFGVAVICGLSLTSIFAAQAGWDELSLPDGKLVVFTTSSKISLLSANERNGLKDLALNGVPIICEGGESELAELLGIDVVDATPPSPYELFAVIIKKGNVQRSHFISAPSFQQKFISDPNNKTLKAITEQELTDRSSPEEIRSALLQEAMDWATKIVAKQQEIVVLEGIQVAAAGQGAWNSIYTNTWTYTATEGGNVVARMTFSINGFKIQDSYSDKDWYLIEERVQHELPMPYQQNFPLIPFTTGFVGWYVQDRDMKIERDGSSGYNYFEDYGPTGTINSGSVSISIGGQIATDPGAGINAGYSKTYNQQDVTIIDQSSPASAYGKWHEDFVCPEGDYSWYPFIDWPCINSKSSFFSYQTAIYRTTNLTNGVKLMLTPNGQVYLDEIYSLLVGYQLTRHGHNFGGIRNIALFKNNLPNQPTTPSITNPIWVNTSATASTSGTDTDGDTLSFKFDWGDGSVSNYGSSSQSHTWTTGGSKSIRSMSKDSPHGGESIWSGSFPLFVNALDHIAISGIDSVSERSGAQYSVTAYFNDGTTASVTSGISWSDDSSYANISSNGYLTTNDVGGQNRSCTITASYTDHGITKTVSKYISILNIKDPLNIAISGLAQVNENSGAQYTATLNYDDGSSTNITNSASWSINSSYANINNSGYLTTLSVPSDQTCNVSATYSGLSNSYPITIKDIPVPNMSVSPSDGLSSSGQQGGPFSPSSKDYIVQNTGTGTLSWSSSKTQNWVSLSQSGGTLGAGQSTTVTVSINSNANGLSAGSYSDTVSFTNNSNSAGNTSRSVSLSVTTQPNMSVSPSDGLSSSGQQGGPFSPSSKDYTVQNTGSGTFSWSASKTQNWVSLSQSSGTLGAGQSTIVTVSINSNANGLSAGSYSDTVSFTNNSNGAGNTTRSVSLTIIPLPCMSVSPSEGLISSGQQGGPFSPSSKTYTVTNTGGGTLSWSASKAQSWVTVSPSSGSLTAGQSTSVTVSINSNANSLSSNNTPYTDTVSFANNTNSCGNTSRSVSLTVSPPNPTISGNAGVDGVTMSGLPGNPITSGGGYYTASVSYGWSGIATPTKTGYTFTLPSRTYINVTSNQLNQDYTAIPGQPAAIRSGCYVASSPSTITINVTPLYGTQNYGVEDTPPSGWTVSNISNSGSWDNVNKKVKWGPFFDATARTLTYSVTAPNSTTGCHTFSGVASFDGSDQPIGGVSQICDDCGVTHPADYPTSDWQITISEVTAYGAGWKSGVTWPVAPNPIPISYVTRAGYIWKNGEHYCYNSQNTPPTCWDVCAAVQVAQAIELLGAQATESGIMTVSGQLGTRIFDPTRYAPEQTLLVSIAVEPNVSTQVYAVEDTPPSGWTVSNINNSGTWDNFNKKVKWGPFFDNSPRTFTYNVLPTAGESGTKVFTCTVSVDGVDTVVTGQINSDQGGNEPNITGSFNPIKYTPAQSVLVSIDVEPNVSTQVYAVEDTPPSGWTVSNINNSGAWDNVNKKVKWGPFFDNSPRTFTYSVLPPSGESGTKVFTCTVSADGVDTVVTRQIENILPGCKFGSFDGQKNVKLTLKDCSNNDVTFSLTGGGYGEMDCKDCTFSSIDLYNTTEKSVFTIKTKGKIEASVGNLMCYGPLKSISAKTTDLRGDIMVTGSLGMLTLDDVAGRRTVTIGPAPNTKAAVMIGFDQADELVINSQTPIKTLTATEWTYGELYAPWVGSITTKGDNKRSIPGDLDLHIDISGSGAPKGAALGSVKVAGTITGGYWDIARGSCGTVQMAASVKDFKFYIKNGNLASLKVVGNKTFGIPAALSGDFSFNSVKSISATDIKDAYLHLGQAPDSAGKILALGSLTIKGSITNCQISSAGNIGTVSAGVMEDSSCFAGVAEGITGLPDAEIASFSETATIKSIAIKGIKTKPYPYFINSSIAAVNILSASLAYPQNLNGGVSFGLAADYIKKLTIKKTDGTSISLKELKEPKDFTTFDDLEIRLY